MSSNQLFTNVVDDSVHHAKNLVNMNTLIRSASRRGFIHDERNEDNLFYRETTDYVTGAVFDGCSTGKDSFFASKLFAVIYQHASFDRFEKEENAASLQEVMFDFTNQLYDFNQQLKLSTEALLSTIVVFLYHKPTQQLEAKFLGDGLAFHTQDGALQIFEVDQENQPTYLAYDLATLAHQPEVFAEYWQGLPSYSIQTTDFGIATDGLNTFQHPTEKIDLDELKNYLLADQKMLNLILLHTDV